MVSVRVRSNYSYQAQVRSGGFKAVTKTCKPTLATLRCLGWIFEHFRRLASLGIGGY